MVLSSHIRDQRDAPVEYYSRRLDQEGRHVLTPGLEVYFSKDLLRPLLGSDKIRYVGGLLSDSIGHRFAYFGVLGNYTLYKGRFHTVELHIGPGFILRESWSDLPVYDPNNPLNESEDFLPGYEYKLLPIGDIDFVIPLSHGKDFIWSIVPGFPYVITQSIGLRWELN